MGNLPVDEVIAKADPVPFGNDALQPSLGKDGEASLSGLNANLRTLCQALGWPTASRAIPRRPPRS
jgi:hypothetical protein